MAGLVDQLLAHLPATVQTDQARISQLAEARILADSFAELVLCSGNVEHIVGDLKGESDAGAVMIERTERRSVSRWCR